MSSRKLEKLAADIDDASTVVEELQGDADPEANADEKLDELHEKLEDASDTIDDMENEEK